jgi:hypothetical protein
MAEEKKTKIIFQDLLVEKIPLQLWKYFLLSLLLHVVMIGLLMITPMAPVKGDYDIPYQPHAENDRAVSSKRDQRRPVTGDRGIASRPKQSDAGQFFKEERSGTGMPTGVAVESTRAEIRESFPKETFSEKDWAPVYQYQVPRRSIQVVDTEDYIKLYSKQFQSPIEKPSSTFSINVDTRSYLRVRQLIKRRRLPSRDLIRIEEMINYFFYSYPQPKDEHPFSITTEAGVCPWNKANWLIHIGIMGKIISAEEVMSDDFIISKEMKIQVQFNPARVKAYRIIGYSSRRPKVGRQKNLWETGGMLSAGQSVTTLYEIIPEKIEPLEEINRSEGERGKTKGDKMEISTIRIRYKLPDDDEFKWLIHKIYKGKESQDLPSDNFRFSAAVAQFGMMLRSSDSKGSVTFSTILELANDALGEDRFGYRAEFIELVKEYKKLTEKGEK